MTGVVHRLDDVEDPQGAQPRGQGRLPSRPTQELLDQRRRANLQRLAPGETIQLVGQCGCRRVTLLRRLRQALQADQFQAARQARIERSRHHRVAAQDFHQRIQRAFRPKRRHAGQQLVQDRPEAINVAGRCDSRFSARWPARGPCNSACRRSLPWLSCRRPRQTPSPNRSRLHRAGRRRPRGCSTV